MNQLERKKILTCDLWIMLYILHQKDKVSIRIQSKKSCLPRIFSLGAVFSHQNLACGAFSLNKNLVHGPSDFGVFFTLPIHWY